MNERHSLRSAVQHALRLLFSFSVVLLLGVSRQVAAQTFAVGGGGMILDDTGTGTDLTGFNTYGGFIFVEMQLEEGVGFQLRAAQFNLPGTQPNTPKLKTNAEMATISYAFMEPWWRAGLFASVGVYHVSPKDLQPGQVSVDSKETVLGFTGGAFTAFALARHWDARLELQWTYIRTVVTHRPVSLTAGVAYKF